MSLNQHAIPLMEPPSCVVSDCGRFRYLLTIPHAAGVGVCLFVLANPSTAIVVDGVFASDPTVTRCIGYGTRWGYGRTVIANARGWRATDPRKVPADPLAVGPENDRHIREAVAAADLVVCGWGALGGRRGPEVLRLIRDAGKVPHALKLTQSGAPGHPLYLRGDAKPFPIPEAGA